MDSNSSGNPSNGSSNPTNKNNRRRHRPRNPKSNGSNQTTDDASLPVQNTESSADGTSNPEASGSDPHSPQHPRNRNRPNQRVTHADPNRVVRKPQRKNPRNLSRREQELVQLRRGMVSIKAIDSEQSEPSKQLKFTEATGFEINMKPSDPDFPFDILSLHFILYVPSNYPLKAPSISVTNTDIPREYSLNVDMGFKELANEGAGNKSLLDLILELDKNLENFLKREKRPTIKIVKFKGGPSKPNTPKKSVTVEEDSTSTTKPSLNQRKEERIIPSEVIAERSKQINQVIHRLGSEAFEYISGDDNETIYNLSLSAEMSPDPSFFKSLLPQEFDGKLNVMLQIPRAYYLEPCTIIISNLLEESTHPSMFPISTIEANFNKSAQRNTHWTLLTHINFLVTRLGKLMRSDYLEYFDQELAAKDPKGKGISRPKQLTEEHDQSPNGTPEEGSSSIAEASENESKELNFSALQEKARRILMALNPTNADNSAQESEAEPKVDEEEEESDEQDTSELPHLEPRGIALRLPGLQMTNIGVLECQFLNLVVKCDRCSTQNDFLNITPGPFGRESKPVAEECLKCKSTLAVSFNKNMLHLQGDQIEHKDGANAPIAGYLDVSGCTPFDMLASTYVATCDNCVTSNSESPFRRVERGKSVTVNCRECHLKMKMQMGSEIQFEKVSDDSLAVERLKGIRVIKQQSRNDQTKQQLGISSGNSLPDDGACTHYRKSRRWYRFSCCGKIFPCDKCHDSASTHPNEHATRIICGKCSREQTISSVCMYCRFEFQTKSSGFWEGGKGTRDPTKLNRNDTRKHKKLPSNKNANKNGNKNGKGGSKKKTGEGRQGQSSSSS